MIAAHAAIVLIASAVVTLPSTPDLGMAEGRCRAEERGPALLVDVTGLKDRRGLLKLELYPANDTDFLADDNVLVSAGKIFRRVEIATPKSGPVEMCIRTPGPGTYALTLLHDRDSNRKFGVSSDGIGFGGNPKLGWSKPSASAASVRVGSNPTRISILLNYRHGLFAFGPLETQ